MPSQAVYEDAARARKAFKLATIIQTLGGDADSAALMIEEDWRQAALLAQVNVPSPQTRSMVIDALKRAEGAVNA